MSPEPTFVSIDLDGRNTSIGRLWFHSAKGRESASFQYDEAWLKHPHRFSLEPQLMLSEGSFHTGIGKSLFGSIGDSAPDRWGRILMRRAQPKSFIELDYLLGVNDESRMGALRFSTTKEGPFLTKNNKKSIPPLIDLPRLLTASDGFLKHEENAEDLRLLLAPGSSLGGARPKATVRDKTGQLSIAKFARPDDEYPLVTWEAIALNLAKMSGLNTPHFQLTDINQKPVLIIQRFDRTQQKRIPFLSAMSMIGAKDNEEHSYLELVDALRRYGAKPKQDMRELWHRIVFSILISNTDDHLRNHAFLYVSPLGWGLSPLYDVNPMPASLKARFLTTAIDLNDTTASLDLALSVCDEYGLKLTDARAIAKQTADATGQWQAIARQHNLNKPDTDFMASAFEHQDLEQARKF